MYPLFRLLDVQYLCEDISLFIGQYCCPNLKKGALSLLVLWRLNGILILDGTKSLLVIRIRDLEIDAPISLPGKKMFHENWEERTISLIFSSITDILMLKTTKNSSIQTAWSTY